MTSFLGNIEIRLPGGAESGALAMDSLENDRDLHVLIAAWPHLPSEAKEQIMSLITRIECAESIEDRMMFQRSSS